jgi:Uma2 family endonuclease
MALPQPKLTLDAFLTWENEQPTRNFFYRGEVFAMVGVRQAHAHVSGNVFAAIKSALRGSPCQTFIADMKLRVDSADAVFYPDVMVGCDPSDRVTPLYLSHPKLIIEVLSDSTAAFDRGEKFVACRRIDTLEEYALVDVDARRVESFRRNAEGLWVLHEFSGAQAIEFASIGVTIDSDTLYENVENVPTQP